MTGKVNSRPLRRPVTVMSASRPLTTLCSGERRSIRTSGLPTRLATAKGAWPLGIPGDATGRHARRQLKETVSRAIRAPSMSPPPRSVVGRKDDRRGGMKAVHHRVARLRCPRDAANGTYYQLFSDERGACPVSDMRLAAGEWGLRREGED